MSLLSVEEFEAVVQTGIDESVIQSAIDREEAELAYLLRGPLTGERDEVYYPGRSYSGPLYLRRFADEVDVVDADDSPLDVTYLSGGAIEHSAGSWPRTVVITYTPNDELRVKRALIELVRDALVPDTDRTAGSARDERDVIAAARRQRLVAGLRPSVGSGTLRVVDTRRISTVTL